MRSIGVGAGLAREIAVSEYDLNGRRVVSVVLARSLAFLFPEPESSPMSVSSPARARLDRSRIMSAKNSVDLSRERVLKWVPVQYARRR